MNLFTSKFKTEHKQSNFPINIFVGILSECTENEILLKYHFYFSSEKKYIYVVHKLTTLIERFS